MRHLAPATLLILAGCSSAGPSGVDQSTPEAVVESWFAAATKADRDVMLSLFSPEGRKEEEASGRSWSKAFSGGGVTLKAREKRSATTEGDTASVIFKVFILLDGKEEADGCRFTLARVDGKWWIVRIG